MNPGTFTDASGATWAIERRLGRGTWTTTWLVRDDQERARVLTLALGPVDLTEQQVAPAALFEACHQAVRHEIERLTTGEEPTAPRLLAHGTLADGRPGFVVPAYPGTLAEKLESAPLAEVLELLGTLTRRLAAAGRQGWVHGNLHAGNVLLDERGDVVLVDPMPAALTSWRARLQELRGGRPQHLPPEAAGTPHAGWDTWAICALAWRAAGASGPTVPAGGLDKLSLAKLRDAALNRLKASSANPRFAPRAADRLATLLHRGLSRETEPSPPYRFRTTTELAERLGEVVGLINPSLEQVGRLLLDRPTGQGTFSSEEAVRFSVTVTPSCRLSTDEIAAAVRLQDLDKDCRVPVPESRFSVKTHPTGRLRFSFELPGVPPGRYQAKVAFLIKDSAEAPATTESELEVRPAPGWVPPREETPVAAPLQLPRATHSPRPPRPSRPQPSAQPATVQALFPAPLSPTPPPSDPDVEEEVADLASGRGVRLTARSSQRGSTPRVHASTPRQAPPTLSTPVPGRVVALAANSPMVAVLAQVEEEEELEEALPSPSETEPDLLELAALESDPATLPRATPASIRAQRERSPVALPPPPPPPRLPRPTPVAPPSPVMARPSLGPAAVKTPVDFEADTHPDQDLASDWDPEHDPFFSEQPTYREPDALPPTVPQPLASEDLVGWREKVKLPDLGVQLPPWAERGLDLLRNDTYSALMAGILVVFILLFLLILAFS